MSTTNSNFFKKINKAERLYYSPGKTLYDYRKL